MHQLEPHPDAIAVVGLAGRFPGASSVSSFWQNLLDCTESVRLGGAAPGPGGTGPAPQADQYGAYGILDSVDQFDAGFFEFTPLEAELLDPQHRLFLECAWTALEEAGCPPARYGEQTGVFASASPSSYLLGDLMTRYQHAGPTEQQRILLANDKDFVATRVSYKLDLCGPSMSIQSACSSSLVAVHQAARSLAAGDCGVAVVGGATIYLPQATVGEYVDGAVVSRDGHCRPFDEAASGTVGGNGVAAVVLRRLADAVRDRNPVLAVIIGSAVNNDGRAKAGFAAPGFDGQVRVVSAALHRSGIDSAQIGFVEAHGTATPIGDPIEVAALAEAFSRYRSGPARAGSCLLGSVKSNIGHLDAAAGMAGFIKAVLCVQHGVIPATLHFQRPNPEFDWDAAPFAVNAQTTEWAQETGLRRAGVTSLGIGGTNAHVILAGHQPAPRKTSPQSGHVFTISARSAEALRDLAKQLQASLAGEPGPPAAEVAFTLQTGRSTLPYRRAVTASSREALLAALDGVTGGAAVVRRQGPVAFLFPGQGAQYARMGSALHAAVPPFRAELDECLHMLQEVSGTDLWGVLTAPDGQDINETAIAQPALFAVEYALAKTLGRLGLEPSVMAGHSIGEYVAATLSGVMTIEDALRFVLRRAEIMHGAPTGAMLAVALAEEAAQPFTRQGVDIAAVNSPTACVLSGPADVIGQIEAELSRDSIASRRLAVSHAFHSRLMDTSLKKLRAAARRLDLRKPEIPFLSNATGTFITAEEATDPEYWVRHARETVRFSKCVSTLLQDAPELVVEVGPGQTLSSIVKRYPGLPGETTVTCSMPTGGAAASEAEFLTGRLAELWESGTSINWAPLWGEAGQIVPLPTYPFQHQRYWVKTGPADAGRNTPAAPGAGPAASQQPASPLGQDASPSRPDLIKAIRQSLQDALGVAALGDEQSFFDAGGDSLVAVQVVLAIRSEHGVEFSLREFLENDTAAQLADLLIGKLGSASEAIAAPNAQAWDTPRLDHVDCVRAQAEPVLRAPAEPASRGAESGLQYSLFFFSASSTAGNRYGFVRECTELADRLGYAAIWTPERHFHQFADLYPNPAVLSAGLATITERVHLRAGSVVAPLHHPARIAEEWAIVDNLSGGRVGLGFAPGFLARDFVFNQGGYAKKEQVTFDRIDKVRRLWRGEAIEDISGTGEHITIRAFPRPVQAELPVWVTAASNPETFANAGRMGFNVLTALLNIDAAQLGERIAVYREARRGQGLDPAAGQVTVMLHTFLGEGTDEDVREVIRTPFRQYLWANSEIIRSAAKALLNNLDIDQLTEDDRETLLDFAFERYYSASSLLGGRETFLARTRQLRAIGVDEIACLIDFGVDLPTALGSIERVAKALHG
jgi:phthiocerol/phenolphthiocerol synthesis type-I polyketide synthase E